MGQRTLRMRRAGYPNDVSGHVGQALGRLGQRSIRGHPAWNEPVGPRGYCTAVEGSSFVLMERVQPPKRKARLSLRDTFDTDIAPRPSRSRSEPPRPRAERNEQERVSQPSDDCFDQPQPEQDFQTFSTQFDTSQPVYPSHNTSAWARNRSEVQRAYICKLAAAELLQTQLVAAQQQLLQQAVDDLLASCPSCHSTSTSTICIGSSQVLVIDICHSYTLTIPARTCNTCLHRYSVRPVDVGCFPSTPVHSWDLLQGQGQQEQMWFTASMLHFLDQLVQTQRRVSYDRLAETILRTQRCIGSDRNVSYDSLRKKLCDAVREFGCMQTHLADMQELGVSDWPAGPLACCAACWQPPSAGEGFKCLFPEADVLWRSCHAA